MNKVGRGQARTHEPHQNLTGWEGGKRKITNLGNRKPKRAPADPQQASREKIETFKIIPRLLFSNQRGRAFVRVVEVRDSRLPPSQPVRFW